MDQKFRGARAARKQLPARRAIIGRSKHKAARPSGGRRWEGACGTVPGQPPSTRVCVGTSEVPWVSSSKVTISNGIDASMRGRHPTTLLLRFSSPPGR